MDTLFQGHRAELHYDIFGTANRGILAHESISVRWPCAMGRAVCGRCGGRGGSSHGICGLLLGFSLFSISEKHFLESVG